MAQTRAADGVAVAILVIVGVVALAATQPQSRSSEILRDAGDAYYEWLTDDDPFLRLKRRLPVERLPDLSLDKERADAERAKTLLARLEQVDRPALTHEESLSLDILTRKLQAATELPRFYWLRFDVTPYASPLSPVVRLFSQLPLDTERDAERYAALLYEVPGFIRQLRVKLEGQAERGTRVPREELALVVPFIREFAAAPERSAFAPSTSRLASLPAGVADRLSRDAAAEIAARIIGWSRAKAVAFMGEHLLETDTQIETESLRYSCDIPGQALAYRMGGWRLRELRDKAQAALGARFDVRRFHEAVLGSGSMPMTTLERHIDHFIETERAR